MSTRTAFLVFVVLGLATACEGASGSAGGFGTLVIGNGTPSPSSR